MIINERDPAHCLPHLVSSQPISKVETMLVGRHITVTLDLESNWGLNLIVAMTSDNENAGSVT